ncbi:YbdD/YjiX family protein [Streptomyces sp. NPDC052236]|uniref:YbdD/YjiX family protein n=1 Tax=Streptomyces sp. NPDC052236 TaxID=3365686 RepID=UPI0037D279E0
MNRLDMTAVKRRAVGWVRWVRWYVREVSGEATYDKYVAHARACDPVTRVMTRREFERSRTDAREADPRDGFRCC